MKIYGIDANALTRPNPTGVERYVRFLLEAMMQIPLEADERVVLYVRSVPVGIDLPSGWSWRPLSFVLSKGWTHIRLGVELILRHSTVLFVPAHEIPMITPRKLSVVTTIHDVAFRTHRDVYDSVAVRRQDFAVQRAIRRAQILLTPSNATRGDLELHYRVAEDRIVVTPLAPTLPVISAQAGIQQTLALLHKLQITKDQYVLSISRLEKKKNIVLLIRAFAMLKRKFGAGSSLVLVLAGSFGYGEEEILRVIREENVADSVRLTGYVSDDDASILLANAMCFAFPSVAEGFGIPVLEAMEHGTPVIASNIAVMREVCGSSAILVSPNDVSALSVAIESMMNTATREEYIAKGKENVKRFSWNITAQETWTALRNAGAIQK